MTKILTFAKVFPEYHPKAGEPTYFIEKIWESIGRCHFYLVPDAELGDFLPKLHTLRSGNRWKAGDKFSPRVWSNKPYRSKQIIFAPDIEIKKVFNIEIYPTHEIYIDNRFFGSYGSENAELLALNDGLSWVDFRAWFSKLPFKGQIICWSDEVKY